MNLAEKTILITGASSGIGRQTAIDISKAGATVIVTGRSEQRLNETMTMLEGKNHIMLVADLLHYQNFKFQNTPNTPTISSRFLSISAGFS